VMSTIVSATILSLGLALPHISPARTTSRAPVVPLMAGDIFDTEIWKKRLEPELRIMPVFMLVNEEGSPLQGQFEGRVCTLYFADTEEAERTRISMKSEGQQLLDVTPSSLSTAYRAQRAGTGVVVPSKDDLTAAGMEDAGASSDVPMFACMDLVTTRADGTDCVPLFTSHADAEHATQQTIKHILQTPGAKVPMMKVSTLSLNKAVEASVLGTHSFRFVPSTRAIEQLSLLRAASKSRSGLESLAERSAAVPSEEADAER